jgi:hypothetical protein
VLPGLTETQLQQIVFLSIDYSTLAAIYNQYTALEEISQVETWKYSECMKRVK